MTTDGAPIARARISDGDDKLMGMERLIPLLLLLHLLHHHRHLHRRRHLLTSTATAMKLPFRFGVASFRSCIVFRSHVYRRHSQSRSLSITVDMLNIFAGGSAIVDKDEGDKVIPIIRTSYCRRLLRKSRSKSNYSTRSLHIPIRTTY